MFTWFFTVSVCAAAAPSTQPAAWPTTVESPAPVFVVLFRADDPKIKLELSPPEMYRVPEWQRTGASAAGRTMDLFAAATQIIPVRGNVARQDGPITTWQLPADERFTLTARLDATQPACPLIEWRLTARQPGWFSVGYAGMGESTPDNLRSLWQPLIWQEKRFPRLSFLSTEFMCSLPTVFFEQNGITRGLVVDPAEIRFRLPGFFDSRFGVAIRNQAGRAQPMMFAPVLGLADSHLSADQIRVFRCRAFALPGDGFTAIKTLAHDVYGYRDYRRNVSGSLNDTIANMIDYAMNDAYSGWDADLKAFDYRSDIPGSVKLVSALHPLAAAIVTDNPEIFRRRALPMIEYMMSREKYLFATRPDVTGQSASHRMKGPCAEIGELAGLYNLSGRRSFAFRKLADDVYGKPRVLNLDMISEGASWQDALARYRMSGDKRYLDTAITGAAAYIERRIRRPQTDLSDVQIEHGGQFWSDFAPKWIDLYELFEETRDRRLLEASAAGAREYAAYTWMQPPIPDAQITVHKANRVAAVNWMPGLSQIVPMFAPEQQVPAWRVSQVGLTPEAANTYNWNPAVMLTHYAAFMLRLARDTGDPFFREIARNAVVGRYANYPGYDINNEYATIYQRADFPLRPWSELTYNNIYYNHVWPHIALLLDYLISDAFVLSDGQVTFPSQYAPGYAYLQSNVYGGRPGRFYDADNVRLWLPRGALRLDNVQINYVMARGENTLCIALMNESAVDQDAQLVLNPDVIPFDDAKPYEVRIWRDNVSAVASQLVQGRFKASVHARGITSLMIKGLHVPSDFQSRLSDTETPPLAERSFTSLAWPAGRITAMRFCFGRNLSSAYVWLDADETKLKAATCRWRTDSAPWQNLTDHNYPFEFSLPVSDKAQRIEITVEGMTLQNERVESAMSLVN